MRFYEFVEEIKSLGFEEKITYSSNSSGYRYIYKILNGVKYEELQISSYNGNYLIYKLINAGHYRIILSSKSLEEILEKLKREIKVIKIKTIIGDYLV